MSTQSTDTTTKSPSVPPPRPPGRRKRILRMLGTALIVLALVGGAEAAITLLWREPVTSAYNAWVQRGLESEFERLAAETPELAGPSREVSQGHEAAARRIATQVKEGDAILRVNAPEAGIDRVVVEGTGTQDLRKGPGRYPGSQLPGLGHTVAIAGHRTTWGAPFRNVDELEEGDEIVVEAPYGTFRYAVSETSVVEADDWPAVADRGLEEVVLTACHPLHNSSQRIVVRATEVSEQRVKAGAAEATASTED